MAAAGGDGSNQFDASRHSGGELNLLHQTDVKGNTVIETRIVQHAGVKMHNSIVPRKMDAVCAEQFETNLRTVRTGREGWPGLWGNPD